MLYLSNPYYTLYSSYLASLFPIVGKVHPLIFICAKGVSRGIHNIALLVLPDRFCAFDLESFHFPILYNMLILINRLCQYLDI